MFVIKLNKLYFFYHLTLSKWNWVAKSQATQFPSEQAAKEMIEDLELQYPKHKGKFSYE